MAVATGRQFALSRFSTVNSRQYTARDSEPRARVGGFILRSGEEFPGEGDELVVVVESGRSGRNRQFIERLAGRLKPETKLFKDLFYKADLTTLGPKGLLLASTNGIAACMAAALTALPALLRILMRQAKLTNHTPNTELVPQYPPSGEP
ncbi:MAG TPA: hypothetical protein VG146_11895 [Verrucomicrobiae bacterium]|nr:hypothetical protein [Verrucomicrobiae bacterium]